MKFVNSTQTKEERSVKYKFARLCGFNYKEAHVLRDYRINKLILNCVKKKKLFGNN